MSWQLDPRTRVLRYVGDFPEPDDTELIEYGYPDPARMCGRPGRAGYDRHRRMGTPICNDCKLAHLEAQADRFAQPAHHDPVAVARAVAGDNPVPLSRGDRVRVVRALAADGIADSLIAARLGITVRSVVRIRQTHAIAAAPAFSMADFGAHRTRRTA